MAIVTQDNVRWKQFNLLDGKTVKEIRKVGEKLKKSVDKVNQILQNAQSMANNVQALIQLLKKVEQIVEGDLYAFVDEILKQFEEIINNVKSTGVYALDLISYHVQDYPILSGLRSGILEGNEWYNAINSISQDNNGDKIYLKHLQKLSDLLGKLYSASDANWMEQCQNLKDEIDQYVAKTTVNPPTLKTLDGCSPN